jgi:hypothetical protein
MYVEFEMPPEDPNAAKQKSKLDVQRPDPKVVIPKEANPWLIALGCVLILLFVAGVGFNRAVGSETKETKPAAASEGAAAEPQEATTTTTKSKDVPSETLLTALLGSGAVLILVGVLYARINSIKLPGGAELTLTQKEEEAATEKVTAVLPDDADPQTVAKVTQATLAKMQEEKAAGRITVPEAKIEHIVEEVTPALV